MTEMEDLDLEIFPRIEAKNVFLPKKQISEIKANNFLNLFFSSTIYKINI